MRRGLALLFGFTFLFAGCLNQSGDEPAPPANDDPPMHLSLEEINARLSQPIYDGVERIEARVVMDDGTGIWLDVYKPEEATEPVPVILTKTPYRSLGNALNLDPLGTTPASPGLAGYYVPRGYAVAYADARGTHNSDGCHLHKQWEQGTDAAAVVEWLAAQEWSNGRVGMIGGSYEGFTQLAAAIHQPEGLATIVPAVSVNSQYSYIYYEGVPYFAQGPGTTSAYFAVSALPPNDPEALPGYPERVLCQGENYQNNLNNDGDYTEYWAQSDIRPHVHKIDVPVLQVHGHQDWNVKPDNIVGVFNEIQSEKRLIIGQFGHSYPTRDDWSLILHRWFDHHLMGIDTGILGDLPPVLTEDSTGQYRAIEAYPPLDPDTVTLWLHGDGALSPAPAPEGRAHLHDYPRTHFGDVDGPVAMVGQTLTGHPPELFFLSEPLEADLHYTGRPLLELTAATQAERTHWAAVLRAVAPDGASTALNFGFLNTRHMDGVGNATVTLTPGAEYEATVQFYPLDQVVPAGHRLQVVLSNAHPMIRQATTFAENVVTFGPEGTRIVFPLAPEGPAVPADHLREGLDPDA